MMALGTLNARIKPMVERLDQRSLRERGLIFGVGVVLIYCLWQWAVMDPIAARTRMVQQRLDGARQKILAVDRAGDAIVQDPAVAAAVRNKVLQRRLEELNQQLSGIAKGYVSPAKMTDLLREMLKAQQGLSLVSLSNLPPRSLSHPERAPGANAAGAGAAAAVTPAANAAEPADHRADPGPFVHPVELVVEGDYASIVAYLHALERLPYQVHWERVELEAREYPRNRVRIVVGALSLSREWLTV